MDNLRILQIHEQAFKVVNDIATDNKDMEIEIGVAPILLVNKKDDTFAIRLKVAYRLNKEIIFIEYAAMIVFMLEGLQQFISANVDLAKLKDAPMIKRALDIAVGTVRGAIAVRCMNTKLKGGCLPDLPLDKLISDLEVKSVGS